MAARSTLTVTSGTTITSAWGNAVRDHAVPYTTSDDVSSNGQLAMNTTSGRLVGRIGGATYPIAGKQSRCALVVDAAYLGWNVTTNVEVGVPGYTELVDTDNYLTGGAQMVAPFAGLYLCCYQLSVPSGPVEDRYAFILSNGTTRAGYSVAPALAAGNTSLSGSALLTLGVGETVELKHYQPSTTSTLWYVANDYFVLSYLGPV